MHIVFKFIKNLIIRIPVTLVFYPFRKALIFLYYLNELIVWIYRNRKKVEYSDFFSLRRDYNKRYQLYAFLCDRFNLSHTNIVYLEFGVASGASFNWWLQHNDCSQSFFAGFDTFEGLPEDWGGFYNKGDMAFKIPDINDARAQFVKGLFQDTLIPFIDNNKAAIQIGGGGVKIIHLDADLYSATAYTLSQLYKFLKPGDILIFDEFNVPLHEFKALTEFRSNFYLNLSPVAAVNNFYQVAFVVE